MNVFIHSGRLVSECVHSHLLSGPRMCPITEGDWSVNVSMCALTVENWSMNVSVHSGRLLSECVHSKWETAQ